MQYNRFYPWLLRQLTKPRARYMVPIVVLGYVVAFATINTNALEAINTIFIVAALLGLYSALLVYTHHRDDDDAEAARRAMIVSRWMAACFSISLLFHIFAGVVGVEVFGPTGLPLLNFVLIATAAIATMMLVKPR